MTRIVIISHSHPNLRYGGGEVAAYRQFQHLLSLGEDAFFVGSTIGPEDSEKFFGRGQQVISFSPRDFCLQGKGMDSFKMEQAKVSDEDWLVEFLAAFKADVYHFHHFWNIGAGTIRRLRKLLPEARFICTLHELTAICANHGQMVKRSGELCYASSEVACAACLSRPPIDFVLRRARMIEMLALFDHLLSPSQFLKDRFEDWGVPKGRIGVIENGLDHRHDEVVESEAMLAQRSGRFAFFGQATPTKGLDVLIRAAALIEAREVELDRPLSIEIHGVDKDSFARMWPDLEVPKSVHFRGRYRPQDCVNIMRGYGWIIIPSVWWENSPVVIQEARAARTPMIASDIGGMAEKTMGWGIQFRVADPAALAEAILSVHGNVERLKEHVAMIDPPLDLAGFTEAWREACELSGTKARIVKGAKVA
ncbi:glycosyltransferase [Paracoccus sp. MBLB3053]|uniref:Glycosyltransferase n=1 Tax=Paracoccus aurantius TaxID=3073814 RepID=A0ABU2HMD5_9RHOB|nr:glycosyltransferase [Paracoccus sp. MBLB3053]MDS9466197.1 glycosyltransferase [Paracoccus sp. MBLB3053]